MHSGNAMLLRADVRSMLAMPILPGQDCVRTYLLTRPSPFRKPVGFDACMISSQQAKQTVQHPCLPAPWPSALRQLGSGETGTYDTTGTRAVPPDRQP